MAEIRSRLALPEAPAMPTVMLGCPAAGTLQSLKKREHQPKVNDVGSATYEWFACILQLLKPPEVRGNKGAREALDTEWHGLANKSAWDTAHPEEKEAVRHRYNKNGEDVHFGSIMEICSIKGSELRTDLQSYKRRIVFRGDTVRDSTGFYATSPNREHQLLTWKQRRFSTA